MTVEEKAFYDKIDQVEFEELMYDEFYELIAEAKNIGYKKAMRWRDPEKELPKIDEMVLIKTKDMKIELKIKQLEWKEYENLRGRKSYFAKTTFSPYEVADGGDHYTMFSPNKRLRFASVEAAKAAAQADFEKRVKECLE